MCNVAPCLHQTNSIHRTIDQQSSSIVISIYTVVHIAHNSKMQMCLLSDILWFDYHNVLTRTILFFRRSMLLVGFATTLIVVVSLLKHVYHWYPLTTPLYTHDTDLTDTLKWHVYLKCSLDRITRSFMFCIMPGLLLVWRRSLFATMVLIIIYLYIYSEYTAFRMVKVNVFQYLTLCYCYRRQKLFFVFHKGLQYAPKKTKWLLKSDRRRRRGRCV